MSALAETLYSDVVSALAELHEIVADETASTGQYSYRYATLATIMPKVRPVLADHGLALSQLVTADDGRLSVATQLVHRSGLTFGVGALTVTMPSQPQAIGSLISYLRRYQLMALLGLAVEDDDATTAQSAPSPAGGHRGAPAGQRASDAQLRLIAGLFSDIGLGGDDARGERMEWVIDVIGRDISRAGELTKGEASRVIDSLNAERVRREHEYDDADHATEGYE